MPLKLAKLGQPLEEISSLALGGAYYFRVYSNFNQVHEIYTLL